MGRSEGLWLTLTSWSSSPISSPTIWISDCGPVLCSTINFKPPFILFLISPFITCGRFSPRIALLLKLVEQEKGWILNAEPPDAAPGAARLARLRGESDSRMTGIGVLPGNLLRAINTGKSMLAGILSQTSGSWLFPVIYCPITGIAIRPAGRSTASLRHRSGSP